MSISYTGYNTKYITMKGNNVNVGDLVSINDENEVETSIDSDPFIGVAVTKRDGIVSVQESGYVEMSYTGATPKANYSPLACAGKGYVKLGNPTETKMYKIIKIDSLNHKIGFLL